VGRAALADVLHLQGAVIVDAGREEQRKEKTPVPAGIEEAARGEQEDILRLMRQRVVDAENDRQEDSEGEGIEQHRCPLEILLVPPLYRAARAAEQGTCGALTVLGLSAVHGKTKANADSLRE
jgi:hypothetical protein